MTNTNNNIITGTKTAGEFAVSYQNCGNGACIPVIDGKPEPMLMFGYVSESDRDGCLKLIKKALRATNGNVMQAMQYMYNAARIAAADIKPDETVEVDGYEMLISYDAKAIYLGDMEMANIADIQAELPNEAVKAMLVDRARLALDEMEREDEEW